MTNPTPAAGTPAADPYLRWETMGGWSAQPDQRTLERGRLESRAKGTDATLKLLRCFPKLEPRARAVDFPDNRAARRQRVGRPQRLGRVAQPRRPRPSGPSPPRQREAQRHAPRLAAITGLIDGQAAADRDAGLDWSIVTAPASTLDERLARAPPRCPSTSTIHASGRINSISGACSPDRSGSTTIWRTTCHGGCSPTPASSTPATCAAGGSARPRGCRSPASGSGRLRHGRAAGRRVRRAGDRVERRVAADAGAGAATRSRLIAELGGRLERDLRSAVIPIGSRDALLERINVHALHAGPRECLDSAGQLAQELSRELRVPVSPGAPRDKRDRWGRPPCAAAPTRALTAPRPRSSSSGC